MDRDEQIPNLSHLAETGDDLVDDKQIRAFIAAPGIVEHRSHFSDSSRDIWDAVQVEQWRFVRPLGRGGFGQVHLEEKVFERFPQSHLGPQLRAVKIVADKKGGLRTRQYLPEILGMAKFSKLGASFVQLFAWFQIDSDICIAMEWAQYGDLEDCVQDPLPEDEAKEIIKQITHAIVIMHERRFLHRDLKPKNVFVFKRRPESPEWRVKLGDFGVSKRVHAAANTSWHTSIDADCSAPEVLGLLTGDFTEESSYANPVDMWSLGYLAHWLLTRQYPVSRFALPRICMSMKPIPIDTLAERGVSESAVNFVQELLHLDPGTRMAATEAIQHPWINQRRESSAPIFDRSMTPSTMHQRTNSIMDKSSEISYRYGVPEPYDYRNSIGDIRGDQPSSQEALPNPAIAHLTSQSVTLSEGEDLPKQESDPVAQSIDNAPKRSQGELHQPATKGTSQVRMATEKSRSTSDMNITEYSGKYFSSNGSPLDLEYRNKKEDQSVRGENKLSSKSTKTAQAEFHEEEPSRGNRLMEHFLRYGDGPDKSLDDLVQSPALDVEPVSDRPAFKSNNSKAETRHSVEKQQPTGEQGLLDQAGIMDHASEMPMNESLKSKDLDLKHHTTSEKHDAEEKHPSAKPKLIETERRRVPNGKENTREAKIKDLKSFAKTFELKSRIPPDLLPILSSDPTKQKDLQDKARKNFEDAMRKRQEEKKISEQLQTSPEIASKMDDFFERFRRPSRKSQDFCYCNNSQTYGEIVACYNQSCPKKWYHLNCLGLDSRPIAARWLCPKCKNGSAV